MQGRSDAPLADRHREAGRALAMQFHLRRPVRALFVERGDGVQGAVQPDDQAAIAAGVDVADGGQGFKVAGLAKDAVDLHGGQRLSGDGMGVVHENEYRTLVDGVEAP